MEILQKMLIVIIFFLFIGLTFSNAQSPKGGAKLHGIVKDSVNGLPLEYATISLVHKDNSNLVTGSVSSVDGSFTIENIPFGKWDLKCTYIGYNNYYINDIEIGKDNKDISLGIINLAPSAIETDEVNVTAEKDFVTYSIDKKVVNISKNLEAQSGTAVDALKNVPSVRTDIEGNISLRGSQNFTVLIDGRPTIMNGQDLLKQLPAASIEQIEIITNPSAKYDPDGTAGIINILMKKDSYGGLNGLVSLSVGTRDKYTGSANINYKEEYYNLFATISSNDHKSYPYSNFIRETFSGDTIYYVKPIMNRLYYSNNYNVNGGIDFNLNEDDVISLSASYGYYGFDRILPSDYTEWSNFSQSNTYFTSSDDNKYGGNYSSADLNYNINFEEEGHKLQSHLSYSNWIGNISGVATKFNTNELFSERYEKINSHRNNTDNGSDKLFTKIDYTLPLSESSVLELGYNGDLIWKTLDFLYQDYDITNQTWQTNNHYTNDSKYRQYVQSIYTTYSDEIFGFQYKLGLRAEYYYRLLDQITLNEKYKYDEYNIFPSIHLSKEIATGHQIQFGYSRRVQRPDHRILNSFADYVDDYYVSQGNPYLKPQFTNSYELNYRMNFERSFVSLETYYRNTNDLFARKSTLMDNGKLLLSYENINRNYLYGTELAANITFTQWLRVYASTNYYRYHLVEILGAKEQNRVTNIADFNVSATLTVSPSTFIQMNGYYTGPRIVADGEVKEFLTGSFSARQDLFNRQLSLILSARNIFGNSRHEFNNSGLNYNSYGFFAQEVNVITLTINYNINNFRQRQSDQGSDGASSIAPSGI